MKQKMIIITVYFLIVCLITIGYSVEYKANSETYNKDYSPRARNGTVVDYNITIDTIWTKAGSPYIINLEPPNSVIVESNTTLTIESGVEIEFMGNSKLIIKGRLIANGFKNEQIFFYGPKSSSTPILIIKGNSSNLSFCKFEAIMLSIFGHNNTISSGIFTQTSIYIMGNRNIISRSKITNLSYWGIAIEHSNFNKILNCTIQNNVRGIDIHNASFNIIYGCIITNNSFGLCINNFLSQKYNLITYNNIIIYNKIYNNRIGMKTWIGDDIVIRGVPYYPNNTIHHNNFINNTQGHYLSDCGVYGNYNIWNDSGDHGNYWSDYNGTDLDFDGVGDTNLPWLGVDWNPLMVPVENISYYLKQVQKIKKLNLELKLNKNQYQPDENITGKLIIKNNNSIDIYTVYPELFGTNITIKPNIFFEIDNKELKQKYFSWDAQILKINKFSNSTLNFSLSAFNYSKGWREDLDKLPEGNYSIFSSFKIYNNSSFSIEVYSSADNFKIIKKIPDTTKNHTLELVKNITISLNLSKQKFQIGEPINGVLNITNNNLVDIELENVDFQRTIGYNFKIQSVDNLFNYGGLSLNFSYPLEIKAQNSSIFEFEINNIIQLPITSKGFNYTNLTTGSYSMYAFFYFGNLSRYDILTSNCGQFQ